MATNETRGMVGTLELAALLTSAVDGNNPRLVQMVRRAAAVERTRQAWEDSMEQEKRVMDLIGDGFISSTVDNEELEDATSKRRSAWLRYEDALAECEKPSEQSTTTMCKGNEDG